MSLEFEGLDAWRQSIRFAKQDIRIAQRIEAATPEAKRRLDAIGSPEVIRRALEKLVADKLTGPGGALNEAFHRSANKDHYPKWLDRRPSKPKGGERYSARGTKAVAGMAQGFTDLWAALSTTRTEMTNTSAEVVVGPGELLRGLRLNRYMRMQGVDSARTDLNSLFLAAEFGTGVAGNVGGPRWVRRDGPTKFSRKGGTPADLAGAWWLANPNSPTNTKGMLFTGQKGMHFLYDERTRRPKEIYRFVILKFLPAYIAAEIGNMEGITTRA